MAKTKRTRVAAPKRNHWPQGCVKPLSQAKVLMPSGSSYILTVYCGKPVVPQTTSQYTDPCKCYEHRFESEETQQ